jgi:hypothetical protein
MKLEIFRQIPGFVKIRPVGAKLFRADEQTDRRMDGQMDMTKLIVALRNFANAPKKQENLKKKIQKLLFFSSHYVI